MTSFALMSDETVNERLTAFLTLLRSADEFHPRQVEDLLDETRALLSIVNRRSGGILFAVLIADLPRDLPAEIRSKLATLH